MSLKRWRCPKCGEEVRAMGIEVFHNCPKTKKNTKMEEVPE